MKRGPWLLTLCAVPLLGCAAPENRVVGGILGGSGIPNANIPVVRSAISGFAQASDEAGHASGAQVVLLSDRRDLCEVLAQNPDLLELPSESFAVFELLLPPDASASSGELTLGALGTQANFVVAGGAGAPVYAFTAASGTVSLVAQPEESADAGSPGLVGSFDTEVTDGAGNPYEVYGQFAAQPCDALAGAYIPKF